MFSLLTNGWRVLRWMSCSLLNAMPAFWLYPLAAWPLRALMLGGRFSVWGYSKKRLSAPCGGICGMKLNWVGIPAVRKQNKLHLIQQQKENKKKRLGATSYDLIILHVFNSLLIFLSNFEYIESSSQSKV